MNIKKSEIPEFRKTQIRLLDTFVDICEKNNLTYWLEGGTLIGAVRHKGFIPWDDDIDLSMPIKDYKKFLEIAEKELPKDIFLQTPETDPTFRQFFFKLRDCYSTFLEHHETDEFIKTHPYHKGIFIDIFPSITYPKMPKIVKRVLMRATGISAYYSLISPQKIFFYYPIYSVCKFFWFFIFLFKKTEYGQTPEDNSYLFTIPLSCLYPLKKAEFEGKMYSVPNNSHIHLSQMYKDYMTPPPPEKRHPHARIIKPNVPYDHPRSLTKKNE